MRFRGVAVAAVVVGLIVGVAPAAQARVTDTWSVDQTPVPGEGEIGILSDVSCATPTFCIAVGGTQNKLGGGEGQPMADIGSGTNWTLSIPTLPAGDTSWYFSDVSCVTTTFCVAVGGNYTTALVEQWDGTSWVHQSVPASDYVTAVSCVSAQFCMATTGDRPMRWDGTSWQWLPAWSTMAAANLSCSSPSRCLAVGANRTSSGPRTKAMAWDGSRWIDVTPTSFGLASVSGVDCLGSTCVVVGSRRTGRHTSVLFTGRYVGPHWQGVGTVSTVSHGMTEVSCQSLTFCVAIDNEPYSEYSAVSENGSWQDAPTPDPVHSQGGGGLDCRQTTPCVYAGWRELPSRQPLIKNRNADGTWSDGQAVGQFVTPPSNGTGMSCVRSFCMSVGVYRVPTDSFPTGYGEYAARWNGTSWQVDLFPDFDIAVGYVVSSAVSCVSAYFCITAGTDEISRIWNGRTWKQQYTPFVITSVSCVSSTDCTGGGHQYADLSQTRIAHWNGTRWNQVTAPAFVGAHAAVTDVACVSATFCLASGAVNTKGATAIWDGTAWTVTAFADEKSISAVSCVSTTFCLSAGTTAGGAGIVKRFDGTAWTTVSVPGLTMAHTLDVSCASATKCLIVNGDPTHAAATTAATWDGTNWTATTPATPPNAANGFDLVAASCTTAYCKTTGSSTDDQPLALIETLR